ncbi:hypothetical protein D8B26_006851 [Coccidioides posadasii str. Silveira]|uniref:Uncharacterized protein n=1 Tax=Coccidioides posadasii (strain RMSCC 757 / Silveira) TaxID=443226 RepID=E9CS41_COCPS|nr:conserved hypothetical protein [Coccidioides posadasii str. Silveira]QVM12217.1 hypothetical protein D8B26_006851 [Coccidioides posadasii str. Silveira]
MIRRNSDVEFSLPNSGVDGRVTPTNVPNEGDVEMISEDTPSPLTLPPHLIARLYPIPKDRRRPSASSSRRSSISSLHSVVSTHGSSHSDHMAQHLRRASIIESRKARLADRAAHVEKVRLRAALAKNATKNALKEERALAAQQAREKLLADIAAKCEEEVRRAKKKAEDIKERKAAEHARLRVEMAEKFAEVERRRLLYQQTLRRPRRTSSVEGKPPKQMPVKKLSQNAAVCIIQKAWRNHRARTTINLFRSLDLSLERIRNLSFEEVGALLSEENVLNVTTKVLRLCGLQDLGESSMSGRGAVRVFLSSYLILSHPAQALSSNGEQEQDLITKAQDLLVIFEQVITQLSSIGVSPVSLSSDLQTLSQSYNTFFSAFHAWKTHDSTVLIEIMLAQFVELELIWQTVKDDRDGGVADDYQKGIRHNQILLLARLKRLAGRDKAMEMVKQALKKAKREKRRNGASSEAIPRAVTDQPSAANRPPEDVHSPLGEVFSADTERWPQDSLENQLSPQDRFVKLLTALPDNRTLVHELLINREYKIDQGSYTEVRGRVMKHMCESMRRDAEVGLGTSLTVAMATVIQDRLLRSLKPGNSLHNLISEVLDPIHIANQCKAGKFSYDAFFDFMSTILPKLCAPFRDPDVKAFAEDTSGDAIDRLARLMGIIDLLSLDHTNFMLQMAAPQLIREGPGYEQRAFSKEVENGTITLEKTRRFWRSNRDSIIEELKKRDPGSSEVTPPVAKIYAQGLVNLVLSNGRLCHDQVPETLSLDHSRLEALRSQSFKIAATAAILLSAKNLLKRDVRCQWKGEAERILSLDFGEIKPERVQSILDSTHPMPAATRSQLFATIKRVLMPASAASATASSSSAPGVIATSGPAASSFIQSSNAPSEIATCARYFTDPVAKLMLSRLRAHVLARLSAASAKERVRTTSTASQSLAAAGMPEFVNEVGKLVDSLNRIREVDWMCHGMTYENIWSEDADE